MVWVISPDAAIHRDSWTVADVSLRKPGSKWWVVVKDMGSCSKYSQSSGLHNVADIWILLCLWWLCCKYQGGNLTLSPAVTNSNHLHIQLEFNDKYWMYFKCILWNDLRCTYNAVGTFTAENSSSSWRLLLCAHISYGCPWILIPYASGLLWNICFISAW